MKPLRLVALVAIAGALASSCQRGNKGQAYPSTTSANTQTTASPVNSSPSVAAPSSRRYVFPVGGVEFQYGHTHHDYPATDIFAPCGAPVFAVTDGVVEYVSRKDTWTAEKDDPNLRGGLSIAITADDGVRYYQSHLSEVVPTVAVSTPVSAGERLGSLGNTGNAKGMNCHLHFGLSPSCAPETWDVRRGVIYPWPFLDAWRAGDPRAPTDAVNAWAADEAGRCTTDHQPTVP